MTSTSRTRLAVALATALLLAVEAATAAAQPASSTTADQLRRDTKAIHALGVSGVQARAVAPDGRQSVATSGTADLSTGRPVAPDGYFRMASTAKTLVATVVLQLEADSVLSLDDTVDHWLPGVVRGKRNDGRRITIRQLLQHTSGIPNVMPGYTTAEEYYQQRHAVYSPGQLVAGAMAHAPDFIPPGEGWAYSNPGYVLLGMIIQRATGHPAHKEIENRVLHPLGLDQTRWTGTSSALPRPHAQAYQLFGPGSRVDVTDQVAVDHETSFATTTRDENRLLRALLAGRLLQPRQLAEMKQTVPVSADVQRLWPGGRYGLGLVERPLTCGGTYWGHEGGDGGYITLNGVTDDGRRSAVVSMSEARGDTYDHILEQENAASTLIDNALCARGRGTS